MNRLLTTEHAFGFVALLSLLALLGWETERVLAALALIGNTAVYLHLRKERRTIENEITERS